MVQTLMRNKIKNKIKNPFFDMSVSHHLTLSHQRLAPDFTNWMMLSPTFHRSASCRSALVRHHSALGNLTTLCIWSIRRDSSGARRGYLLQNQSFLVQSCSLEFLLVFFHHKCLLLTYLTHLKARLEAKQA